MSPLFMFLDAALSMGSTQDGRVDFPDDEFLDQTVRVEGNRSFANAVDVTLGTTYNGTYYWSDSNTLISTTPHGPGASGRQPSGMPMDTLLRSIVAQYGTIIPTAYCSGPHCSLSAKGF